MIDEARMLEAEGAIAGYQQNMLLLVLRFDDAVKDAEANLATEKFGQQRDQAELEELRKEQQRREALLAKRLIDEQTAGSLRPRIAALEQAMTAYGHLIKIHEDRLREAVTRREEMKRWLRLEKTEDVSDAIEQKMAARAAILAASRKSLAMRRENYVLRANREGIVSRIFHEPGDVIPAGEPILRLVSEHSDHILGFLPEVHVVDLAVGQKVYAWRPTGEGAVVPATVESIAPEVQALPGRISPIRGLPLRGRRVILKIDGDSDFVPGETVQIRSRSSALQDTLQEWSRIAKRKMSAN
jgi:multidrug resistance efflux pump